jgi:hypothetical protein
MRSPRYPRYDDAWGQCGTCGFDVPVRWLVLTRKHGWQCLPGSGRTRGCFDSNFDRDDIIYIPSSGEGARLSPAPLTNIAAEGTEGDPPPNSIYMTDQVTGQIYLVQFTDTGLVTTAVGASVGAPPVKCLGISNRQECGLSIRNGQFFLFCGGGITDCAVNSLGTLLNVTQPPGANGGGSVTVTPPGGGTPIPVTLPPPVAKIQVNEPWEWLRLDASMRVNEPWELTLPSVGPKRVDEGWESL